MTKQEAMEELKRAAELGPKTRLAEACRTLIAWAEQPHDCINCRHKDRTPGVYPCSQCEQKYSDNPTMWEPKEGRRE